MTLPHSLLLIPPNQSFNRCLFTNYMLWKAQFLPLLKCTSLIGFVDNTNPCPSLYKCDSPTPHFAYTEWHKLDQ